MSARSSTSSFKSLDEQQLSPDNPPNSADNHTLLPGNPDNSANQCTHNNDEIAAEVEIPSDREIRRQSRNFTKSLETFQKLLVTADASLIDLQSRHSSGVHVSFSQAIDHLDVYIEMLNIRINKAETDSASDKQKYEDALNTAKQKHSSLTKAYADRIQELTVIHDNASSVEQHLLPADTTSKARSNSKKSSRSSTKSSRKSSSSKKSSAAQRRLKELELEDEYERKALKRRKERLRLQEELDNLDSGSDESSVITIESNGNSQKSSPPAAEVSNGNKHNPPTHVQDESDLIPSNTNRPTTSNLVGVTASNSSLQPPDKTSAPTAANDSSIIDKLLHLKVMERRFERFNGDPLKYLSFRREFEALMRKFPDDRHYLFNELLASLSGPALEAVQHCRDFVGDITASSDALDMALHILKRDFGSDYQVRQAHLRILTDPTNQIQWDQSSFRKLLSDLNKCSTLLSSPTQRVYLESPDTIKAVVNRLPFRSKNRFVSMCASLEDPSNPGFSFLMKFVENELIQTSMTFAELLSDNDSSSVQSKGHSNQKKPYYHREVKSNQHASNTCPDSHHSTAYQATFNRQPQQSNPCHFCKTLGHRLKDCQDFNNLSVEERWDFIKEKSNLCSSCFGTHDKSACRSRYHCRHCKSKDHHSMLCTASYAQASAALNPTSSNTETALSSTSLSGLAVMEPVYIRVVPLIAHNEEGQEMQLYALLDSGSMVTLCSKRVCEHLNLSGPSSSLSLQGVNSTQTLDGTEVRFAVKGIYSGAKSYELKKVVSIPSLPSPTRSIPTSAVTAQHHHLKDISFPTIASGSIDMIIGSDNELLHQVTESRSSPTSDLHGYLTPLGWVLAGTDNQSHLPVNSVMTSTFCSFTSNRVLHSDYGIEISDHVMETVKNIMHSCPDEKDSEEIANSAEDEAVIDLFVRERQKSEDGHFILPIPLRDKSLDIPNNRSFAETRLKSLTKTLKRNPDLKEFYVNKMSDMSDKTYLKEVPPPLPSQPNVVYLHHFPTKQAKRRIVLDAASSDLGRSFNSYLMQGPDLMQPLVDVLSRFRQDSVAFACDIKEMFHQVKLPQNDKLSLRVLWYKNHNIDGPTQDYEITVHPFGLKSSPAAANFSVRQTALDNLTGASPDTVDVMMRQLYVDDCLNSEDCSESAIQRINELNELAASSGFKFVKYTSNCREVLDSLDPELLLPDLRELNLRQDGLPTHKTLGVFWDPTSDVLTFKINIKECSNSKRGMLSLICSIFDPLGMALPYIMTGRRILQEAFACSEPNQWDAPLPEPISRKWNGWIKHLSKLESIFIPRCYHISGSRPEEYELHTFADASNTGISTVCFLRYSKDGRWNCTFIRGRGHVIPLNTTWSTARYELEAAVMAANLHAEVSNALDLPIGQSILWTDSATVLSWLNNITQRPKVFVYNRRKEILRLTSNTQWRYINTTCNPADLATRGIPSCEISGDCLWLKGPEFMLLPKDQWPVWNIPGVNHDDLELSTVHNCSTAEAASYTGSFEKIPEPLHNHDLTPEEKINQLLWRYSSLHRLLKITAWLNRLTYKHKLKSLCLSSDELDKALLTVIRLAQREYFSPTVIEKLKIESFNSVLNRCRDGRIKSQLCSIQKLSPFIDEHGVLRVGGRLQYSDLPYDMVHPIILPRRHQVTQLIIEDRHNTNHHFGGSQYILNHLAARFWVNQATVKYYLDKCLMCRRIRAETGNQIMAPLPAVRVTVGRHPFTATGVDYAGPIIVKVKRSEVKRWVALFTCLSTRAIHIEKVYSLETSSFLQAFFRFRCARNGIVKQLYSDNATTFHGADNELKKAIARLEEEGFKEKLLEKGVDWHFNTPLASHWGGVWERQIRSIRKILLAIPAFERTTPSDELLDTVLKEAECIINNRPLTAVHGDPESIPVITPGMLLIGSLAPSTPIDVVHDGDDLRRSWRYTQIAAEQFWEKFLREYLKNLQPRPKWYQSYPNVKLGDIVLVKESRINHRPNYPKAIITQLNPGPDGHVRSVHLRFADGRTLVRDIRKIVPLQCLEDNSEKRTNPQN